MKYDVNLLRDIILTIAQNLEPDEYGYIEEIDTLEFVKIFFKNYKSNEILYWIRQLMDARIIIPGSKYVDQPIPQIKDLSLNGYRFVDVTKNPSTWESIKPKLFDVAINSIPALIEKAISLTTLSSI